MYSVEFKANIKNGIVHIPNHFQDLQEKKDVKFIVMIDENDNKNKMNAISIDTTDFSFNREEANER
ncbi:MAG: hypothetical protein KZQ83_19525 [gamma proteobacterium symbiont of Taylorina sp.]|nr:hypothetical protein [gamma proteobacterium symbiont of Taylorina sp.]